MQTGPQIAQVATMVGDPARANVLTALMDGHRECRRQPDYGRACHIGWL
jgi:uridine phosphorylase